MRGDAQRSIVEQPQSEPVSELSRRTFLAVAAALAARTAAGSPFGYQVPQPAARGLPLRRVGVQLYTVRSLMRQDFDGTLAVIAEIGYDEVEFAGYFDRTPSQVREALERVSLAAPSTHVPYDTLAGDWQRVLDDSAAIGHSYVTVPWLPDRVRGSLSGWHRVADEFNEAGRVAREAGLTFSYHNHDFDFRLTEGAIPLNVLIERTDPELVTFELDLYWMVRAGHDPLEYIAAYPGRFPLHHVKDSAGPDEHRMVDVGAGVIDFDTILQRAAEAGARHYFVEHDSPEDPMATARAGYAALTAPGD